MMATNNTSGTAGNSQGANSSSSDYIDPRYLAAAAMCLADYGEDDLGDRQRWIHECRMFLFSRLGAILTVSGGSVRYWVVSRIPGFAGSQRRPIRIGFYAGFCSESRGLHWDRKRD